MKTIIAASILAVTVLGVYIHHVNQDPCEEATMIILAANYGEIDTHWEEVYAKCVWARATGMQR